MVALAWAYKWQKMLDSGEVASLDELAERYRGQAEAYALAVREASGTPPREVVIFFMRTGDAVPLPPTADDRAPGDTLTALLSEEADPPA